MPDPRELWGQYRTHPSTELRNQIFEHYQPLLERICKNFKPRLFEDESEILGAAAIGLIEAIEQCGDREFEKFAISRMTREIKDQCREMDHLGKSQRSLARKLDRDHGEHSSISSDLLHAVRTHASAPVALEYDPADPSAREPWQGLLIDEYKDTILNTLSKAFPAEQVELFVARFFAGKTARQISLEANLPYTKTTRWLVKMVTYVREHCDLNDPD